MQMHLQPQLHYTTLINDMKSRYNYNYNCSCNYTCNYHYIALHDATLIALHHATTTSTLPYTTLHYTRVHNTTVHYNMLH